MNPRGREEAAGQARPLARREGGPLLAECESDAKLARFCVLLAQVGGAIHYALMPAPQVPGQEPAFATAGMEGRLLEEEIAEFGRRVEARGRT
jgi:hypothetical protein